MGDEDLNRHRGWLNFIEVLVFDSHDVHAQMRPIRRAPNIYWLANDQVATLPFDSVLTHGRAGSESTKAL